MVFCYVFQDSKDGTCAVEYFPTAPGDYDVNITYGGQNIPGSPFGVSIKDVVDPSKVICFSTRLAMATHFSRESPKACLFSF